MMVVEMAESMVAMKAPTLVELMVAMKAYS